MGPGVETAALAGLLGVAKPKLLPVT